MESEKVEEKKLRLLVHFIDPERYTSIDALKAAINSFVSQPFVVEVVSITHEPVVLADGIDRVVILIKYKGYIQ